MLKDLYIRMSVDQVNEKHSKNAFRLLRTGLNYSKQQRNGTISKDISGKVGAIENPQASLKPQRTIVLNESGIVDFKQTLRKYQEHGG
jgi:hypothetical protein